MSKKIIIALLASACFGSINAAAQAVITFKENIHNFGKFKEEAPQTCEFKFKNEGDKPLIINQATASCGCTVPTFSKEPIMPGKTGKITVVYNGKSKLPGPFKKSITILTNASNNLVRLYIQGDMEASERK